MLYTLVDPNPGHEVAYNRWYERDHFYAGCMIGPWLFAGRRWVATRALKDLRFPADSSVADPVDRGSYLAIYWVLEGHHDDHFSWASTQVWELYGQDRGFAERRHAHTVMFNSPWSQYRDDDPVPIELALDHGYAGLVSVFVDRAEGHDDAEVAETLRAAASEHLLGPDSPVASSVSWKPIPRNDEVDGNAPMDLGSPTGGDGRTLQLFFVESDPSTCWQQFRDYGAAIDASGVARVALAAPFLATVIGTDTYTDQLW